jgi:hypothetical protein
MLVAGAAQLGAMAELGSCYSNPLHTEFQHTHCPLLLLLVFCSKAGVSLDAY